MAATSFPVTCPMCWNVAAADKDLLGEVIRCSKCGNRFECRKDSPKHLLEAEMSPKERLAFAIEQFRQGKPAKAIRMALLVRGAEKDDVNAILEEAEEAERAAVYTHGMKWLLVGCMVAAMSVVLTIGTLVNLQLGFIPFLFGAPFFFGCFIALIGFREILTGKRSLISQMF